MRRVGTKRAQRPITWHTEQRKLSDLKRWEHNPRQATDKDAEDLANSLERFNLATPLVINQDGTIIGGHFRYEILTRNNGKHKLVDVRVPSRALTEAEVQELNVRLNKNLGRWDLDRLANFDEEFLTDVGFDREELDSIFGLAIADDFNIGRAVEKATQGKIRPQPGDIWTLGRHRLVVGSATDGSAWQAALEGQQFDLLLTDPPYRLAYSNKRVRKIRTRQGMQLKHARSYLETGETTKDGKAKDEGTGVPEYDEWLQHANAHQQAKGANILVFENWRNVVALWTALEQYWRIRNLIIWHLPHRYQGFSARHRFFNKFDIAPLATSEESPLTEEYERELDEYLQASGQKLLDTYEILLFGNAAGAYWDKGKARVKRTERWAKVSDHITWDDDSQQSVIFGTKPLQLILPYVKILAPRNGRVVDPFGGSGTTLIASEIMHRACSMIEISPTYAEVILTRWEQATGQEAKRSGSAR